jgi:hypothetical protein
VGQLEIAVIMDPTHLVKDQDLAGPHKRSRERNQLPLTLTQVASASCDLEVECQALWRRGARLGTPDRSET